MPDATIGFDDLILFALNYTPAVSRPARATPASAGGNVLALRAPYVVNPGEVLRVPVQLEGGGDLQGVSVALGWDPAVVTATGIDAGNLDGGVVFSPGPARVDAAMLGAGRGLAGSLTLATMKFRAVGGGDPKFVFTRVQGRDAKNHSVPVASRTPVISDAPVTVTDLMPVIPNPSRGDAFIEYSLVRTGDVELTVFSVDGARVRTLARGPQDAGRYHVVWNGTDERGAPVRSGLYFVRLRAGSVVSNRLMTLIR